MCGFGIVHSLLQIGDGLQLNIAITRARRRGRTRSVRDSPLAESRRPAGRSPAGPRSAPWSSACSAGPPITSSPHAREPGPRPVVVLVSCLLVAALGFSAAFTHLLRVLVPAPDTAADTPDTEDVWAAIAARRAEWPTRFAHASRGRTGR